MAGIVAVSSGDIHAQQFSEYEVKAGYLYNFTKFVTWPEEVFSSEKSPFVIGIYGDDPFGNVLEMVLKDRKILNRNWIIVHYSAPEDIGNCHMLFISGLQKNELIDLLEKIRKKPILTIGNNIEDFCEYGGIINFTGKYSKYRFYINNNSASRNKLVISSKLLMLAKIVTEDEIKF
ncbi:MAG: YfiR family protein [Bacteroidota bacterium]